MSKQTKALAQLRKANKLSNRAFHKVGPKSYKKGQGALLKILHVNGGSQTSRELVEALGFDRGALKDVVRKAQRNGYVTIEEADQKRTYAVQLTEKGEEVAEKRCKAHDKAAGEILGGLSDEEIEQLNALTEKIILTCKDLGAHGGRKGGKKRHRKHRK